MSPPPVCARSCCWQPDSTRGPTGWTGRTAPTVFELDQPQVLQFKRDTMAAQGAAPRAERREIAVDLREDWQQALRDNGFRSDQPSAWIAEGLLIYLPAGAQEQLFNGIDSLASPGSHLAVEEGRPMDADVFKAKVQEAKTALPTSAGSGGSWCTTNSTPLRRSGFPSGAGPQRQRR